MEENEEIISHEATKNAKGEIFNGRDEGEECLTPIGKLRTLNKVAKNLALRSRDQTTRREKSASRKAAKTAKGEERGSAV